jgi:hypothetical protein
MFKLGVGFEVKVEVIDTTVNGDSASVAADGWVTTFWEGTRGGCTSEE